MDDDFADGYDEYDDEGPADPGSADADADDAPAIVRYRLPLELCEAVLEISGQDLDPDEITQVLGCEPTEAHGTGTVVQGARMTMEVLRGYWFLRAGTDVRVSPVGQVDAILDRLTDDFAAWERLANRYMVELHLDVMVDDDIRSFRIDPGLLGRLSERRIHLDVHISPE